MSSTRLVDTTSTTTTTKKKMKCISCKEEYGSSDAGTCKECYEEASETEEELKQEIEELKSKVAFLRFPSPVDYNRSSSSSSSSCFTDVFLVASDDHDRDKGAPFVPAHKTVLASRSPVFKAMLENEMEESRSGTIRISDVSYDALRNFVQYLYTAEVSLDEQMACDLLVLAEKYEVKYLKSHCEKFLMSKLNAENAFMCFAFSSQHYAKNLHETSLSLIVENMDKLTKQEEYQELVEKDPRLIVGIYEAYLAKQVNTAAAKD
ncbi:hypothetical protein AQUCO_02100028v1 [Aquilegia coerulea]|uniref:BTB domain-containing protein n=1 Tax=Aquilegia coerulea TaxID=218851 RepID=A0A2G5DEF5_AQUCA|nr:hypothetical protein AQUCO_02100028v1 [Aquilegia coerulea]